MTETITPSQTVGPFFHYGLIRPGQTDIAPSQVPGQRIVVEGRVLDGDGQPVPDAMIEVWQADAEGRYAHPADPHGRGANSGFAGHGRAPTDTAGVWRVTTVKPGAVPHPKGGTQAPHLTLGVFARGLLLRLHTRVYFDDEAANATDPVLASIDADRRGTLIAKGDAAGGTPVYRLDIRLQGDGETVFFLA
jgi:protocatechuate 3,4-dioxygenase alpha subunit